VRIERANFLSDEIGGGVLSAETVGIVVQDSIVAGNRPFFHAWVTAGGVERTKHCAVGCWFEIGDLQDCVSTTLCFLGSTETYALEGQQSCWASACLWSSAALDSDGPSSTASFVSESAMLRSDYFLSESGLPGSDSFVSESALLRRDSFVSGLGLLGSDSAAISPLMSEEGKSEGAGGDWKIGVICAAVVAVVVGIVGLVCILWRPKRSESGDEMAERRSIVSESLTLPGDRMSQLMSVTKDDEAWMSAGLLSTQESTCDDS
jgi:hypothetical protein